MKQFDSEFFVCECSSDEHTLRFILDDYCIYTDVYLNDWQNCYTRLWVGIKYIFGYKCKYGHWDCFMMNPEDIPRFRKMLDDFEALNKEREDKIKQKENK
jgi:hypothetical protein